MTAFTEPMAFELMIHDAAAKLGSDPRHGCQPYTPAERVLPRPGDIMVEPWLRDALIRLNPEIAAEPIALTISLKYLNQNLGIVK